MANPFDQFDAEQKPSAPATRTPSDFASAYGGAAKRAGDKLGVDPNVLLGQWGLETGWGKSVVPGTNNLGNIKDMTGSGVAATDNMTGSKDKYRSFATPDDFADHYADLISRKYQGAVGSGSDASKFAGALTAGGYAEDPNYAAKIQAAHRMVSKAGNPVLRVANAVTDAIMPSANAATPVNPFDQFDAPAASAGPAKQVASTQNQPELQAPNPTDGNSFLQNALIGVGRGIHNLGQGVGQRLREGITAVVPQSGIADTLGLPTQADVDASRKIDAPLMQTAGGKIGNFGANMLPAAAAAVVPGAQGLAGSLATGAVMGAVEPTATGESVIGNTLAGAAGGGIGYGVGKGIARIVSPNASTNAQLQLLKDEGVKPTIGQTLGGAWNTAEQKLQSVPIMGDAITTARNGTRDQLNTAAFNRALNSIGQEAQSGAIGREGVQSVKNSLGNAYDNLLPKLKFQSDPQFSSEMSTLTNMIGNGNIKPEFAKQFNNIVQNEVLSRMTPQGAMDGKSFKALESSLSQKIKGFSGSLDPDQKSMGSALQEVLNSARANLSRTNPQYADQLASINKGYANYATIRRAASGVGANEGVFTPAQLQSAVRAGDKSAGKGAFATGNGLMQDLSEAGKTILGNNFPNSGTTDRALMGSGIAALATGLVNPTIPLSIIGTGLAGATAYTKPVQSILNAAVSSRPEIAQPIGGAIRKYAGALAPAGAQLGIGAIQKKSDVPRYSDGGLIGDNSSPLPGLGARMLSYGKDVLQSASNTAASNVSGPIDAIAWGLRKAGVPVGDKPVGGSNWMAQQGLTAPVQNQSAGLVGETLGMAAPIGIAAKAPQVARGILQAGENLSAPVATGPLAAQKGMLNWHGELPKNDLVQPHLEDLISSQRYLDRDIVAQKIKDGNFDVRVTPSFDIDGNQVRAITDGHHALEAAIRSGNKPNFITDTKLTNDRIGSLESGDIDNYLESAYHDSPWYQYATKRELF